MTKSADWKIITIKTSCLQVDLQIECNVTQFPEKKAENSQDNVEDEQRTTHLTLPDTKIYIQLLQLYQCGAGKTQGKIKKPMEYESRARHTHLPQISEERTVFSISSTGLVRNPYR